MHKEKFKKVKDGEKYHEKYLNRHLEVHLAIDTCFKEPDKDTIDMKELKFKEEMDAKKKKI